MAQICTCQSVVITGETLECDVSSISLGLFAVEATQAFLEGEFSDTNHVVALVLRLDSGLWYVTASGTSAAFLKLYLDTKNCEHHFLERL